MTDLPSPPFRDAKTLTNVKPVNESDSVNFTALWQEWFTKSKNQTDTNTAAIADHETRITALETQLEAYFHIGIIFETTNSTNPGVYLGFGTWVLYGVGRVTVCLDSADEDFDTIGETGGDKTADVAAHTHTLSAHTHDMNDHVHDIDHTHGAGANIGAGTDLSASFTGTSGLPDPTSTEGPSVDVTGSDGDESVSIMNPYIVVYRWRRSA